MALIHVTALFCLYLVSQVTAITYSYGELDNSTTLICEVSSFRMQWITPEHQIIHPDGFYDDEKYVFDLNNNSKLMVYNLQASDAGVFLCGIPVDADTEETISANQVQLRVKLPYADTDYSDNAVTGIVVAIIVAALFAAVCLVYKYRYRENSSPEYLPDEIRVEPTREPVKEDLNKGVENPAMDDSDDEDAAKKREEKEKEATKPQETSRKSSSSDSGGKPETTTDGNIAETGM